MGTLKCLNPSETPLFRNSASSASYLFITNLGILLPYFLLIAPGMDLSRYLFEGYLLLEVCIMTKTLLIHYLRHRWNAVTDSE
jgi:hypothetical protein